MASVNSGAPTTGSETPNQAQDFIANVGPRSRTQTNESMKPKSVLDFQDFSKNINNSMDDLAGEFDTYFTGPLDTSRHSKLPFFMRIRGSVMPSLIVPILFVGGWTTAFCVAAKKTNSFTIQPQLITVLGFIVGMMLSFRCSTALERYQEGRKYWAQLTLNARNLARLFWIHGREREGEQGVEDVLTKLTAMNLILAFCVAMKHKLRFEPEVDYQDIQELIWNLKTFAKDVHEEGAIPPRYEPGRFKRLMDYLGVTFFQSNPSKRLKVYRRHGKHSGNLPYEIANYLSSYTDIVIQEGTLPIPGSQSMAMTYLSNMMDSLTGCERILQTPLPLAYNIVISQVTWLYVLTLPFQLFKSLGWITIPATVVAAYMILGIAAIGREIENPFGSDVNDLDLDRYCESISIELDILTATPPPTKEDFIFVETNKTMFPNAADGFVSWKRKGMEHIRHELRHKPYRHLAPSMARAVNEQQMKEHQQQKVEKWNEAEEREKAEEEAKQREERLKRQQEQSTAAHGAGHAAPDTAGAAADAV